MKKGNNKSTKGKKNWRKNIDTTEIDKKDIKHRDQVRVQKEIAGLKDSELFEIDVEPIRGVKEKLIGQKVKRSTTSKVEERMIKRMKQSEEYCVKKPEVSTKEDSLWGDAADSKKSIKLKTEQLKYPKLPLPHPGQSYNPSKSDLSNLLVKVVEMNKKPDIVEQLKKPTNVEKKTFDSEDEEDNDIPLEDFNPSNNPPVDDYTQRRTKTQRNKAIKKRLNIIKSEQQRVRKQTKKQMLTVKGLKRFEKEKEKALKQEKDKKLRTLREKKEKEELIKIGIVEE
jgi:hypothetical protein